MRDGSLPLIAIAGSRGKSTVCDLLASIFEQAGLTWASKNANGVSIRGAEQPDAGAWDRVLRGLGENVFDIAIEELEWPEVAEANQAAHGYAAVAVTNICANRDECLIQDEAKLAVASLPRLVDATATSGVLVVNCEDVAVIDPALGHERTTVFVGQNADNPVLQFHLESGGLGAWRASGPSGGTLYCGMLGNAAAFGDPADFQFMLWGVAGFQITNTLTAIALAASCGIPADVIRQALAKHEPKLNQPIAIFHVTEANGVKIVVDRPNPSWHMRQVIRAVRDARAPRVITLVGRLDSAPPTDLPEVGRLLGRLSNVLIVHSSAADEERVNLLRQGVAQNSRPPVIVHTQNEQRALALAMDRARRDDLIFVLADDPPMINSEIEKARPDFLHPHSDQREHLLTAAF
jgi:cyanophycin synthetase